MIAGSVVDVQRLSDEDVDRIASRVAARLLGQIVLIALAAVAAIWVLPYIVFALLGSVAKATTSLPLPVSVAILATILAAPVIALILMRTRRIRGG